MSNAYGANLGRLHALRRLAGSVLLNQVMMKRMARRDLDAQPALAIFSHDLIGQAINIYGWWEHEELILLRGFLRDRGGRGGAMLDVGANIGNHTVFLREMFDEVHAVEANPRTFRLLQFNVEPFDHVQAHHFAASDADGVLEFAVDRRNVGASRIVAAGQSGATSALHLKVPACRIDDAIVPANPLRLVKLDVEGHELSVLRGARQLLARDRPVVVFEQHAEDFVDGSSPVIDELRMLGYRRFHRVSRVPSSRGTGRLGKLLANLGALARGFRIEAVETDRFEPGFYEMIIASCD